ncbi:hypothetical protein [Undibacterium sp. TS12]|uniref:hypothetical protein n=1 Tax=Undibacterium sp. TS12 TaxID=2908202 RepID=UPI001F4CE200|nr:hypothetical protein [Undibacterium sp. TS12]MCH8618023.1 hypothetical protein [Undibacterium sp. TS12]
MRRPELIFDDALRAFLKREGSSLLTNVSERNTCGRLALFIERQLEQEGVSGYYADVEYNRKQRDKVKTIINDQFQVVSITADLIVHSRGEILAPNDNLIAVEVKKSSRPAHEKDDDVARLIAMTRVPHDGVWAWEGGHPEHVCGYSVGVFMEIRRERHEILVEYFKLGKKTKEQLFVIPIR